ncbi:MAG: Na(+)-translocating NADH-quinone reductase subunit A [Rikenellaceae bacterium]
MSNHIRLRRGLNIPLKGSALNQITKNISSDILAVKPADFKSLNPKLLVKEGDAVKAGTPVMADKKNPAIVFCSPTSGVILEIVRGEKRRLLEIRIQSDKKNEHLQMTTPNFRSASKKELIDTLVTSGLWPTIKQRPYGIIPNPEVEPKSIFISGFDSSPLAPDLDFALKAEVEPIQIGVDILNMLTKGGVHVSLHAQNYASSPFHKLEKVINHSFDGPHPAGNVGVQIHNIDPINKGDVVWTIDLYSVAAIGKLFTKGIYDVRKIIAITGPRVKNPSYVECLPGMCMSDIKEYILTNGENKGDQLPVRYVSGNILTGDNVGPEGFLGFYHNQITLLSEGNYHEMFGWIKPFRLKKFSFSHSYFSWLTPSRKYSMDTNLNGGERAFVMTGIYEKVLPMDIYPMHLLKAILAEDIDKMEALGIYEVIEEDLALCEFVCPSKTEVQEIVSKGIDLMIKEMS